MTDAPVVITLVSGIITMVGLCVWLCKRALTLAGNHINHNTRALNKLCRLIEKRIPEEEEEEE